MFFSNVIAPVSEQYSLSATHLILLDRSKDAVQQTI